MTHTSLLRRVRGARAAAQFSWVGRESACVHVRNLFSPYIRYYLVFFLRALRIAQRLQVTDPFDRIYEVHRGGLYRRSEIHHA